MASKKFKNKPCSYCGRHGVETIPEHVLARSMFLLDDRANLPKVPACKRCNTYKSALEGYASIALLAGSRHEDSEKVRVALVAPRLAKNAAVYRDLGIARPGQWMNVNGIFQKMHALTIDAKKINELMEYVVRGLYKDEFGSIVTGNYVVDVNLLHPSAERAVADGYADAFGSQSTVRQKSFGRQSFEYEVLKAPGENAVSLWRMRWHGGVALHGQNAPPEGVSAWWAIVQPANLDELETNSD